MWAVIQAIDDFLIDGYQRFIGDPLQLRGISLFVQWRTFAVAFIACTLARAFRAALDRDFALLAMAGFSFVIYFSSVMWPSSVHGDMSPEVRLKPNSAGFRNPVRSIPLFRLIRVITLTCLFDIPSGPFFVLMELADAADPKPPKPRRMSIPDGVPDAA